MSTELVTGHITPTFSRPNGEIDVKGLCGALEIERARLPDVIGVKRQTVAHYFRKDADFIKLRRSEAQEFFKKLAHIYVLIRAVMDENASEEDIVRWFHAPNKALTMKSPRDLVYEKKLDVLIQKLMDVLTAAQGA